MRQGGRSHKDEDYVLLVEERDSFTGARGKLSRFQ